LTNARFVADIRQIALTVAVTWNVVVAVAALTGLTVNVGTNAARILRPIITVLI